MALDYIQFVQQHPGQNNNGKDILWILRNKGVWYKCNVKTSDCQERIHFTMQSMNVKASSLYAVKKY